MKKFLLFIFLLTTFVLVACDNINIPFVSTPTPMAQIMCTPPPCQANENLVCPDGDCPGGCGYICAAASPTDVGGLSPVPESWDDLEIWLVNAWRTGVNPAAVRAALWTAGRQSGYADWRGVDIDGDFQDEWVLVLLQPGTEAPVFGRIGTLWVVNGTGVVYRRYETVDADSVENVAPDLIEIVDMTGDGRPEVVLDAQFCGASTCYGNYHIVSAAKGGIQNIVNNPSEFPDQINLISVSYPNTYFQDVQGDGLPDFNVHGGSQGSAGAGLVRTFTEVWAWDGNAVSHISTLYDPTEYRHHILYEANDRMAAGALDEALLLYEKSINSGTLITVGFTQDTAVTYQDISQFAAFRLILIDLLQGDSARAGHRLLWMEQNYPGRPAAQAARVLVTEWTNPDGAAALCGRIESDMGTLENPTGALENMGYGNPGLTAVDFCP